MKKTLLVTMLLSCSLMVQAQIPLTRDCAPKVGTVVKSKFIQKNSAVNDEGLAGAGRVYDFSSYTVDNEEHTVSYIARESSPYASDFPNANIVGDMGEGSYTFYEITNEQIATHGVAFSVEDEEGEESNLVYKYSPKQVNFRFPLNYQVEQTSTYAGSADMGGVLMYRTGKDTVKMDGYGELIHPGGAKEDVVRVRIGQHTVDSVNTNDMVMLTKSDLITYSFYSAIDQTHIMNVIYMKAKIEMYVFGMLMNTQSHDDKNIVYNGSGTATFTRKGNSSGSMNLFPNPANDKVNAEITANEAGEYSLKVSDLNGLALKQDVGYLSSGKNNILLDVTGLQGVYLVELNVAGQKEVRKLVVR